MIPNTFCSYLGKVLAIWGGTNRKIFHLFRWKCKKCHFRKISGGGLSLVIPPLLPRYAFVTSQFCRLKSICDTLFRKCQGKTFVIWVMLKVCWKYNHSYINFGRILWPISFVHVCKEAFLIFVVLLSPLLCKGEEKSISSSIIPSVSLKVAKNKEEE